MTRVTIPASPGTYTLAGMNVVVDSSLTPSEVSRLSDILSSPGVQLLYSDLRVNSIIVTDQIPGSADQPQLTIDGRADVYGRRIWLNNRIAGLVTAYHELGHIKTYDVFVSGSANYDALIARLSNSDDPYVIDALSAGNTDEALSEAIYKDRTSFSEYVTPLDNAGYSYGPNSWDAHTQGLSPGGEYTALTESLDPDMIISLKSRSPTGDPIWDDAVKYELALRGYPIETIDTVMYERYTEYRSDLMSLKGLALDDYA